MRPINAKSEEVSIADAAVDLPSPPVAFGSVAHWNDRRPSITPELDLNVWANATIALTSARLLAGQPKPFALADDDVDTVDDTNDELDLTAHAYQTGDGPVRLTTSGTLPLGLSASVDYWIIVVGVNSIALATSLRNALEGTRMDIEDAGSGTHTIVDTAATRRIVWFAFGNLGPLGDGAIDLTADIGYTTRVRHSPNVVAYALAASMSPSDPEAVSATVSPIIEV